MRPQAYRYLQLRPAQSFRCEALALPAFRHLVTNTWALIGHELAATNVLETLDLAGIPLRTVDRADWRATIR